MRYRMTQKLFAMGDDFTIADATGKDVFFVDGKAFALGKKLSFQDMAGQELAFLTQRLLSLHRVYEIHRNGRLFAEVRKEFSLFRDHYTVDVPGPNDYTVTGSFLDHEYRFLRDGREVACVSKEFFTWADSYGIEIADGEDDIAILATAVCIDLVNQASRR